RLRDTESGTVFTVLGTHLASALPLVRLEQARELVKRACEAKEHGPVVDADEQPEGLSKQVDAEIRKLFADAGFIDKSLPNPVEGRPTIDFVYTWGFE